MTRVNSKTLTAVVSAVALTTSGLAVITPVLTGCDSPASSAAVQQGDGVAAKSVVKMANVEGAFSFDQGILSTTAEISGRFTQAAATLCTTMPAYFDSVREQPITIGGDVDSAVSATLSDIAAEEGAEAFEMACSCASNIAGGGAIANAEVEGVSLESIAEMVDAQ